MFLLDDGHDGRLEAISVLNKQNQTRSHGKTVAVQEMPRKVPRDTPSYYKSGSLRFGIETTKGRSDFFAALDADMIVEPDWVRSMVPRLLLDDELALACPPQVVSLDGYLPSTKQG